MLSYVDIAVVAILYGKCTVAVQIQIHNLTMSATCSVCHCIRWDTWSKKYFGRLADLCILLNSCQKMVINKSISCKIWIFYGYQQYTCIICSFRKYYWIMTSGHLNADISRTKKFTLPVFGYVAAKTLSFHLGQRSSIGHTNSWSRSRSKYG